MAETDGNKPMIKKSLPYYFLACTVIPTHAAHADFIGLYASYDYFMSTGNTQTTGVLPFINLPVDQQFGFDAKKSPVIAVVFEHPIAALPNIRLRQNNFPVSANTSGLLPFKFNGQYYSGSVSLAGNLNNTDITLYYRVFDNTLYRISLGLNAKVMDGNINVTDHILTSSSSKALKDTIPMLYAAAAVNIPATNVSVNSQFMGMQYKQSYFTDMQADIKYVFLKHTAVDLAVKGGYRQFKADLKNLSDSTAVITLNGPFAGVEAHFNQKPSSFTQRQWIYLNELPCLVIGKVPSVCIP